MRFFTRTLVLISAMAVGANSSYAVTPRTVDAPVTASRSVNISYEPEDQRAMECDRAIYEDESPGTENKDDNKSGGNCADRFIGGAAAVAGRSGSNGSNRSDRGNGGSGGNSSDRGNGGNGGNGGNRSGGDCASKFSK